MSVSTKYLSSMENVNRVLDTYLAPDKPTVGETSRRVGTTYHNVRKILADHLDPDIYKREVSLRKSRAKMGKKNPMFELYGDQHHNFKGDIFTKDGYLQRKVDGRYELVHRIVMAKLLGLRSLPDTMDVHHIDDVKTNNSEDNLALVTRGGHRGLHAKQSKLSKSPIWVQHAHTTSQLRNTTRI